MNEKSRRITMTVFGVLIAGIRVSWLFDIYISKLDITGSIRHTFQIHT